MQPLNGNVMLIVMDMGYDVKVVWEADYKAAPQKTILECVEFSKF